MRDFELLFPETLPQACEMLGAYDGQVRLLAGGTSVLQFLKEGLYKPKALVGLHRLPGLDSVHLKSGALHVGAMARPSDVHGAAVVRSAAPILGVALSLVGNVRVRNVATLGGNLCHADPHADAPTALTALDAELVVTDGVQSRRLPAREFWLDYYETALQDGEMLESIVVPARPAGQVGSYRRFTATSEEDWPCVTLAAVGRLERQGQSPVCTDLRMVVGALEARPKLIEDLSSWLPLEAGDADRRGGLVKAVMEQLEPIDDLLGSAWYKREIAGVLAGDALADVFQQG